jgi:hypothetical protein
MSSRPALRSTQRPIRCVPGDLPQDIKRPGHETHQSPRTRAKVTNAWIYTATPSICLHVVVLNYLSTDAISPFTSRYVFREQLAVAGLVNTSPYTATTMHKPWTTNSWQLLGWSTPLHILLPPCTSPGPRRRPQKLNAAAQP